MPGSGEGLRRARKTDHSEGYRGLEIHATTSPARTRQQPAWAHMQLTDRTTVAKVPLTGLSSEVGEAANAFIADPTAAAKQYVPANENILAYTDIVQPNKSETIYFTMPQTEGVHPFACTFPGHWMVMNGLLTLPQLPKR